MPNSASKKTVKNPARTTTSTPPVDSNTNCSSLRSSRDSRVSRSSSPSSNSVRDESVRKERSDRKTEKEQRNSKTSRSTESNNKVLASKSNGSNSTANNLSSSSQSSLSSSHSLDQQAKRYSKHEGRGKHRHEESRGSGYSGRYDYASGEVVGESRSEYKRKKANISDDEEVSSKARRVSGQKQYAAEGLCSQRLEYSSSGRFGGQLGRSKGEYGGRGEFSEHRDRYSRSSSQMQQGFGEFRRNRSKEREGNC